MGESSLSPKSVAASNFSRSSPSLSAIKASVQASLPSPKTKSESVSTTGAASNASRSRFRQA